MYAFFYVTQIFIKSIQLNFRLSNFEFMFEKKKKLSTFWNTNNLCMSIEMVYVTNHYV